MNKTNLGVGVKDQSDLMEVQGVEANILNSS